MRLNMASAAVCLMLCAGTAMAQSKDDIQKLNDQWCAAFNKGDTAGLAALYTEDAYLLPAGAPMVKGRAAIQGFFGKATQQLGNVKITTIDVKPLGPDAVREIGTATFTTKGHTPHPGALKYAVVWEKDPEGKWRLSQDIWNMDK